MDKEDVGCAFVCIHTYVYVCTYTMEYYSPIKRMKYCHFSNIDPEIIITNEVIRQRKRNIKWYHLHIESKKQY